MARTSVYECIQYIARGVFAGGLRGQWRGGGVRRTSRMSGYDESEIRGGNTCALKERVAESTCLLTQCAATAIATSIATTLNFEHIY